MNNVDNKVIGKLIKKLREDHNMSLNDLALELSVSKVIVNQWELGNKGCSVNNLCKLSKIFNVSVEELVEGKLHNEDSLEYLERNFDLSCFNVSELISTRNIKQLEEFLRRCLSIKYRFCYGLLLDYAKDKLTTKEKIEFDYIRKFVAFDSRVFADRYESDIRIINNKAIDFGLEAAIKEYILGLSDLKDDALFWEIDKIVNLNINIDLNEIFKLGINDISEMAIYLCNQQLKDEILAQNIEGKTAEELSGNDAIGSIVTCGGNCIYRFMRTPNNIWDEDAFNFIEGKPVEDVERLEAWEYAIRPGFNAGGQVSVYGYRDEWKEMSYDKYQKTIMKKKTRYIEDLCTLKYAYPKRYYQLMKDGEYDTYL